MGQALRRYMRRNFLVLAAFAGVHIGTGWLFLRRAGAVTEPGVPLDDAWIHFVFARNLVTHGQLAFNVGQPSGGATSLLWVFLLAIGYRVIGNLVVVAWILGVGASLLVTVSVFELAKELFAARDHSERWAFLTALGYAACGVVVWHQLSGMEAPLFLAWGLLAVLTYRRRHLAGTGLLLGLLILTRIEGVMLLALITAAEVARRREDLPRLGRALLSLVGLPMALNLPALLYTYQTTGRLLPTTLAGRRWLIGLGQPLWALDWAKSLLEFPARWVYYVYAYLFMGVGASDLPFTVVPSAFGRSRPVNLLYLGLVASLLLVGGVFFWRTLIQRRRRHSGPVTRVGLFAGWVGLHNLIYLFFLPWTGHAGRYQIMNFVGVWLLVGAALAGLSDIVSARGSRWAYGTRVLVGLGFVLLLSMNILGLKLWSGYYVLGVQRINTLHVQAGRWMARHLSEGARPAAFDIGAIGYFARQNVVDLSGLTTEDYLDFVYADRVTEYLARERVTHVALTEFVRPGVEGFNDILNIYRHRGEAYRLTPLQSYDVSYTADALATSNAGSSMRIFRVDWPGRNSDDTTAP